MQAQCYKTINSAYQHNLTKNLNNLTFIVKNNDDVLYTMYAEKLYTTPKNELIIKIIDSSNNVTENNFEKDFDKKLEEYKKKAEEYKIKKAQEEQNQKEEAERKKQEQKAEAERKKQEKKNNTQSSYTLITSDGIKKVNSNDFSIIEEETSGTRNENGVYTVKGKIKQNIDGSYTGLVLTLRLLDKNGNKVRNTTGLFYTNYLGNNIWEFVVNGNDADGIVEGYEIDTCYGY